MGTVTCTVGAELFAEKIRMTAALRERVKRLNPDFALIGETLAAESRMVLDGWYERHMHENGRIFCYLFSEVPQQVVLVGNYAYDAVNRALMLELSVDTEIWGLRTTARRGCPELARYLGHVNRLRRRYAHVLIRGRFRDTVGARVTGPVLYGVLEGPHGSKALVLRNHRPEPATVVTALDGAKGPLRLCRIGRAERPLHRLPVKLRLAPFEAAVILARVRARSSRMEQ
jgi:hypothetical protein